MPSEKPVSALFAVAFVLLVVSHSPLFLPLCFAQGSTPDAILAGGTMSSDTIWRGEVHITDRLVVTSGTTLTIAPGTVVRFAETKGMWANGAIIALGTKDKPIRFSLLGDHGNNRRWHQIMVEKSEAAFTHCLFEYAEVGLHSHFSKLSVDHCRFSKNETGMMFKGGPIAISASEFMENTFGAVFNVAEGTLEKSNITGNEVGIMVRAHEEGGIEVHNSNIFNNSRYNLKMGDFNNGLDIDVRNNWWGGANAADTMFDDRFEPGIGRALWEPVAGEAFAVKN